MNKLDRYSIEELASAVDIIGKIDNSDATYKLREAINKEIESRE